jgi:hypothetical protein
MVSFFYHKHERRGKSVSEIRIAAAEVPGLPGGKHLPYSPMDSSSLTPPFPKLSIGTEGEILDKVKILYLIYHIAFNPLEEAL